MGNPGKPPLEAKSEDAGWDTKISAEKDSKERTDLPLGYAEKAEMAEKAERLENDKQRRGHRENLMTFILLACGAMLLFFVLITWILYASDDKSLPQNPWFFLPLALMGILPTTIILSILKGLYKSDDQSECLTAKDLTLASQIATIGRPFIGKSS